MHAILPSTFAVARPTPIGPFCFMISVSNVKTSPGTTFRLNFAELIPAKYAPKELQPLRSVPVPQ